MYQETLLTWLSKWTRKKNQEIVIWNIKIGELCYAINSFQWMPFFLEDFIEILISNRPYMIIKSEKIGEFGLLWIHNFERFIIWFPDFWISELGFGNLELVNPCHKQLIVLNIFFQILLKRKRHFKLMQNKGDMLQH